MVEGNVAQECLRTTADYREGFADLQQKRKAEFTGGYKRSASSTFGTSQLASSK